MPTVKRPGRQVAPILSSPGALPGPSFKYATQKVGALQQQTGASLVALGGDFAKLAINVHNTQVREEFEDAKLLYDEKMNAFLAEQETNPDYATWEGATTQQHDTLVSTTEKSLRTVQAKEEFSAWARANRSVLLAQTSTKAYRLSADKARSMVRTRLENYAKRGTPDEFKEYIREMEEDGLMLPEEVEFWDAEIDEFAQRWEQLQYLTQVETTALNILDEAGYDVAVKFVRDSAQDPRSKGADIRKLINLVEFMEKVNQFVGEEERREARRAEISEFTTQIREGTLDPRRVEASEHGISHQKQWKNYLQNSMRDVPEVDWRRYLDLEDKLFDYWNKDKTEYELAIVEARYGDSAIMSNDEYDGLLTRVGLDVPKQYMVSLRTAFETIRRDGNNWSRLGVRKLSQEEAQRVAQARSALFDWLLEDRISKKKETSPEEFYTRAKMVAVLFQPGMVRFQPKDVSTPMGVFENWLSAQPKPLPGTLLESLNVDLHNALKRVKEGADPAAVFQLILDTYKDEHTVQEFLGEIIQPIVKEKR